MRRRRAFCLAPAGMTQCAKAPPETPHGRPQHPVAGRAQRPHRHHARQYPAADRAGGGDVRRRR